MPSALIAPRVNSSHRSVVFLTPGFPTDESDSTCIPALQSYVLQFARSHPEVSVAVIAFEYPVTARQYRWHGIEVYAAGGRNRRGPLRRLTWLRAAVAFRKIRRQTKVDVIHSFWLGECTLVGQRLARRFGGRQVASIMGQDATTANSYISRLDLDRMILTCGSTFAARHFETATGRTVDQIIPFGLDVDQFPPLATACDIDIIGVGSLTALKNYALFVRLVAELLPEFPTVTAALIGDGPERANLEREITKYGLADRLVLRGELPRHEVLEHLARSRIFLHPSLYESQGYVFLEALYAGLPVIGFDVGHRPRSPRSLVCRSKEEMREHLRTLLHTPLPRERVAAETIADTVVAFRRVYGF